MSAAAGRGPAADAVGRAPAGAVPHQAIVLCAGEGRRLRPFTSRCPKPLMPFLNVPLLEHVLVGLERAGVSRVALNAWHLAGQLEDYAAQRANSGLSLHVEREPELLGTGGGLANLRPWLAPGPVLVTTSDVLCDAPLQALAARHAASGAEATMLLATHADTARYGAVCVDEDGLLTDIVGRLGRPGVGSFVNASFHILEPAFLERLPTGRCCLVRDGYLPALAAGARCAGQPHAGAWAELGCADTLLAAQRAALSGSLPVEADLLTRGGLRHGADNLVHPGACVAADAVLADGSVVGPGCTVGAGAVVRASLLLPGARVQAGATIEHAILDARPNTVGAA